MAPSQNETTVPAPAALPTTSSRRQSCDRCYGQKLRCTRQGKEGACNRCLKQGAQCVYTGFSLPKGRPSVSALARSRTPPTTPAERRRSSTVHNASLRTIGEDNFDARMKASEQEDSKIAPAVPNSASITTSPPSLQWPFDMDWNDMIGDLNDPESNHTSSTSLPTNLGSLDSAMSFDPFLNVDPSASLVDWTAIGLEETLERSNSIGSNYENSVGIDGLNSGMSLDRSPYAAIAQLSQLSTRLYPLHQSSCVLAEAAAASFSGNRSQQTPLIDDSCLKNVANWFVHLFARMPLHISADYGTKNTGEVLQSVFSASHYMLEILRRLQNDGSSYESGRDTGAGLMSVQPGQVGNDSTAALNILTPGGNYSHNTIICHLVIACHTLLLNVYVAVLIALQHDVDLRSSYLSAKCSGYLEGETQLVMVVQLCAYLLERQRQAVDIYFTPSPPSPPLAQMMVTPPNTPPTANREVVSHLEADIRQRLTRIRQALRI